MYRKRLIPAFLALALPFAAVAADLFEVTEPYARAVPPGQPNSAAFLNITNHDSIDHALVGASSSVSQVTELHTHTMEDGMMKMRQVEKIALPAGETVSLQPGGLHIMLIGLNDQFKPESEAQITLEFDDGSSETVTAPVRRLEMKMKPMAPAGHGMHQ